MIVLVEKLYLWTVRNKFIRRAGKDIAEFAKLSIVDYEKFENFYYFSAISAFIFIDHTEYNMH